MRNRHVPEATIVESFTESDKAVQRMAAVYAAKYECEVEVPEVKVRPSYSARHSYADDGDFFLLTDPLDIMCEIRPKLRIEVKHRDSVDFTSANSFPYGTVMVMEDYTHDRRMKDNDWPWHTIIVNKRMSCALVIPDHTRREWTMARRYDRRYREWRTYMECSIHRVEEIQL